jgi:hypothetical protein
MSNKNKKPDATIARNDTLILDENNNECSLKEEFQKLSELSELRERENIESYNLISKLLEESILCQKELEQTRIDLSLSFAENEDKAEMIQKLNLVIVDKDKEIEDLKKEVDCLDSKLDKHEVAEKRLKLSNNHLLSKYNDLKKTLPAQQSRKKISYLKMLNQIVKQFYESNLANCLTKTHEEIKTFIEYAKVNDLINNLEVETEGNSSVLDTTLDVCNMTIDVDNKNDNGIEINEFSIGEKSIKIMNKTADLIEMGNWKFVSFVNGREAFSYKFHKAVMIWPNKEIKVNITC